MSENKPRKPMFGEKGTLPGGAGRYSLSSRPPKSSERADLANEPKIPGPAKVPAEATLSEPLVNQTLGSRSVAGEPIPKGAVAREPIARDPLASQAPPEALIDTSTAEGAARGHGESTPKDAWKGSTLGGWGTEVPKGTSMANLKSTLALGSSPLRAPGKGAPSSPKVLEEPSPGTIRGTPPPPAHASSQPPAETKTVPPAGPPGGGSPFAVAGRRISVTDEGRNPSQGAGANREAAGSGFSIPPETPHTQRATVPPMRESEAPRIVKTIEVEPVRINQSLNTRLPSALAPLCDELGAGSAATVEVSLLTAPRASRATLYVSAVAIARRMAQVLPGQVVLVETDFETPGLAATLGITLPRGRGFSEQLHARAWGGERGRWHLVNPGLGFDALFESRIRTPGLLWSDEFANAIATLRANYSVILLIAPNRITAVDHRALGDVTTGAYVISKEGDKEAVNCLSRGPLAHKVRQSIVIIDEPAPVKVQA